ncbi:CPBP family intramembrane metalloprotease [Actinocrinis puniceicyclus]|uniref:CPBP family intramembrane metalloprotease n=1 Tax=Actinocrinis puniceicyclus TaxID=977794 RepID=A0A8J7WME6_9ACTN|nr:CPBP family intramembrane glutamic endopeptidase [Actinocrinis puniceicyclus]MBS2965068.1 CPBP family intramembrane metalloprotease [Actinocrinis puniceicyclus]
MSDAAQPLPSSAGQDIASAPAPAAVPPVSLVAAPVAPPVPPATAPGFAPQSAVQPAESPTAAVPAISPLRAFAEVGVVYLVSFGLGVISAVGLLTNPTLASDQQIRSWVEAGSEMMQYIMQACTVIFGVAYFSLRRGLTLSSIFGHFAKPRPPAVYTPYAAYPAYAGADYPGAAYPGAANQAAQTQYPYPAQTQLYAPPYSAPAPSGYQSYAPYPQMGYVPSRPAERGRGWQFTRAFFLSMGGVLAFLLTVVIYVNVTGRTTGAPDQGNSLWMVPVGIVVALCAGFGEEVLITAMVVTALEQAGFARRAWVIYLVAVALRIPFHLYYGWASLAVVCFTVVNVWVYRRWRLLWPIVIAHAVYDALEFAGSLVPALAGLGLIALGLATFVMVIVIAGIELSDRSARRRFEQWRTAVGV